jgi:hypothetical protein
MAAAIMIFASCLLVRVLVTRLIVAILSFDFRELPSMTFVGSFREASLGWIDVEDTLVIKKETKMNLKYLLGGLTIFVLQFVFLSCNFSYYSFCDFCVFLCVANSIQQRILMIKIGNLHLLIPKMSLTISRIS